MLGEKNGNALRIDAINREKENLKVAFDILEDGAKIQFNYDKSSGHLAFDVCMTLEWKARQVKDGHRTPEIEWSTFSRVVFRESVLIALTCSDLNELPVYSCDIQKVYLQAPSSKKQHIVYGL